MTEATGWAVMLRTAMALGVSPEGFWRLSLKEWRMLTAREPGVVPMGRSEVEALMRAWPDQAFSLPLGEGRHRSAMTGMGTRACWTSPCRPHPVSAALRPPSPAGGGRKD